MQAPWGPVLESIALADVAPHFFTGKTAPVVAADGGATDWAALGARIGVRPDRVWRFHQVHGDCVERLIVTDVLPSPAPRADAGVTLRSDVAISVRVADCVPILLADQDGRGVAAVHAGWRGAAAGIVERAVEALSQATGAAADRIIAAIGPSIGPCCYEVGEDVRAAFLAADIEGAQHFLPHGGKWRLDLWQAVARRLETAGVERRHVHVAGLCTATHLDWFFSYRKQGSKAGRMLAVIRRR